MEHDYSLQRYNSRHVVSVLSLQFISTRGPHACSLRTFPLVAVALAAVCRYCCPLALNNCHCLGASIAAACRLRKQFMKAREEKEQKSTKWWIMKCALKYFVNVVIV